MVGELFLIHKFGNDNVLVVIIEKENGNEDIAAPNGRTIVNRSTNYLELITTKGRR